MVLNIRVGEAATERLSAELIEACWLLKHAHSAKIKKKTLHFRIFEILEQTQHLHSENEIFRKKHISFKVYFLHNTIIIIFTRTFMCK